MKRLLKITFILLSIVITGLLIIACLTPVYIPSRGEDDDLDDMTDDTWVDDLDL